MRILCDACSAKYSIDDDRVAGRVFKIRCKKCSHVIVLRGAEVEEPPPEPSPEPPREPEPSQSRLRGERNDTSVLFTLGNLAQIAQDTRPAQATTTTEGSGLIDMRTMASAYLGTPTPAPARVGSVEDLPVYAHAVYAEPAVFVPTPPGATRARMIRVLVAMVGVLAIVIMAEMTVLLVRQGTPRRTPAPVTQEKPAPVAQNDRVLAPAPEAPRTDVTTPTAPPLPVAAVAPVIVTPPPVAPPARESRRTSQRTTERREHAAPPPTAPAAACDQVACVVSGFASPCCEQFRDKPEQISKGLVATAMAAVASSIKACGTRSTATGKVTVRVTVSSAATVSTTIVAAPDTTLGSCVAAAIRGARFPATHKGAAFSYAWTF